MQRLSAVRLERAPQSETNVSLSRTSRPLLPADSVKSLAVMMAETQAYFPNQTLPPGTPAVYLRAWEEIAHKYGMERFRDALWKVLRESEAFFPMPITIERKCSEQCRYDSSARVIAEHKRYEDHRKAHPEEYIHIATDSDFQALRERVDPAFRARREMEEQ